MTRTRGMHMGQKKMKMNMVLRQFNKNYNNVRKLIDVDGKQDPETEPYSSQRKAKKILLLMRKTLKEALNPKYVMDRNKLEPMLGVVLLNLGIVEMEFENLESCEKILLEVVSLLSPNPLKPETVTILTNAYNHLGIMWFNSAQPKKAKNYFIKAMDLYEKFKTTAQTPLSIQFITSQEEDNDAQIMESAHNLTLHGLSEMYEYFDENLKAAICIHMLSKRHVVSNTVDPVDWSMNTSKIAHAFAKNDGFYQARHHLAAATKVIMQYQQDLLATASKKMLDQAKTEAANQGFADIARRWVKYCVMLLTASKKRITDKVKTDPITDLSNVQLEGNDHLYDGDLKDLVFPDYDISAYENKITDQFVVTHEEAHKVYLFCKMWQFHAKQYYKVNISTSIYIDLTLDFSTTLNHLAFYEEMDDRKLLLHLQRIEILESLTKRFNTRKFLDFARRVWLELGDVYSQMMNVELNKLKKSIGVANATSDLRVGINCLGEKSIENYEQVIESVKDIDGEIPKLDSELLRLVVNVYVHIGRNSMKRLHSDVMSKLNYIMKSFDAYQQVVILCKKNKDAVESMPSEYHLCQVLVKILPIKLLSLQVQSILLH